jgi:hypothetical protein
MSAEISWWREGDGASCGRLTGRVKSAGCRWRQASEGELWLWLNREGSGLVWGKGERFVLQPGMYALTGGGDREEWTCVRYPGQHAMELVKISRAWLARKLRRRKRLPGELTTWLEKGGRLAFCGLMGAWEKELCLALAEGAEAKEASVAERRLLAWASARLFRGKPEEENPNS